MTTDDEQGEFVEPLPEPVYVLAELVEKDNRPGFATSQPAAAGSGRVLLLIGLIGGVLFLLVAALGMGGYFLVRHAIQSVEYSEAATARRTTSLIQNDDVPEYENREMRLQNSHKAFAAGRSRPAAVAGATQAGPVPEPGDAQDFIARLQAAYRNEDKVAVSLFLDKQRYLARTNQAIAELAPQSSPTRRVVRDAADAYFDDEVWMHEMQLHHVELHPVREGHATFFLFGDTADNSAFCEVILWCVRDPEKGWLIYDWERLDLGYTESEFAAKTAIDTRPDQVDQCFDLIQEIARSTTSGDRQRAEDLLFSVSRKAGNTDWEALLRLMCGYWWNQLECPEMAIREFRLARAVEELPGTWYGEATSLALLDDHLNALSAVQRYIDLTGYSPDSLELKASSLHALGRVAEEFEARKQQSRFRDLSAYYIAKCLRHHGEDLVSLQSTMNELDLTASILQDMTSYYLDELSAPAVRAVRDYAVESIPFDTPEDQRFLVQSLEAVALVREQKHEQAAQVFRDLATDDSLGDGQRETAVSQLLSLSSWFDDLDALAGDAATAQDILENVYYEEWYDDDLTVTTAKKQWLEKYLQANPDDAEALEIQAEFLLVEGDFEQAETIFRKLLLQPLDGDASEEAVAGRRNRLQSQIARTLIGRGQWREAVAATSDSLTLLEIADQCLSRKDQETLEWMVGEASQIDPGKQGVAEYVSACLARLMGDSLEAIRLFRLGSEKAGEYGSYRFNNAIGLVASENPVPEVLRELDPLEDLYSETYGSLKRLGNREAMEQLNELADSVPELHEEILLNRIEMLAEAGDWESVLKLVPELPATRPVSWRDSLTDLAARASCHTHKELAERFWMSAGGEYYLAPRLEILRAIALRDRKKAQELARLWLDQHRDLTELCSTPEILEAVRENGLPEWRKSMPWTIPWQGNGVVLVAWFDGIVEIDRLEIENRLNLSEAMNGLKLFLGQVESPMVRTFSITDQQNLESIWVSVGSIPLDLAIYPSDRDWDSIRERASKAGSWIAIGTSGIGSNLRSRKRVMQIQDLLGGLTSQSPVMMQLAGDCGDWFFEGGFEGSVDSESIASRIAARKCRSGSFWVSLPNPDTDSDSTEMNAREQETKRLELEAELSRLRAETAAGGSRATVVFTLNHGLTRESLKIGECRFVVLSGQEFVEGRLIRDSILQPFLQTGDMIRIPLHLIESVKSVPVAVEE